MSKLLPKLFELLKKPGTQIILLVAFLSIVSGGAWGIYQTQIPPEQPIQFPHNIHVGLQIQCLYCHPGAWRQASAGIPTQTKCWGCHQQIPIKTADQQKLADYVKAEMPIPWVPVFIQPDFVYFNHRPHIAAGVNCETCHGELSYMKVAQPQPKRNMGWCLNCHRTKAANDPEKFTRLTDCATCHR
jgi:hypothetical protein